MSTWSWRSTPPRQVMARLRGLRDSGDNGRPHYVVCGGDSLAYRLVDELVEHGVEVTVILRRRPRADGPDVTTIPGVHPITAEHLDERTLRSAKVDTATALALVDQDDVGNIHAALRARDLNPHMRIVIRMFNRGIGDAFRKLLGECEILSDADLAAPAFVATALDEVEPSRFPLRGRSLHVARRSEVDPQDVVCGLADLSAPVRPLFLPDDEDRADMVLAFAHGEPRIGTVIAAQRIARSRRRRRPLAVLMRMLRAMVNRKLGIAILVVLGLILACGAALARALGLGLGEGVYVALLTTITGADAEITGVEVESDSSAWIKVLEVALTLIGLALVPLITAAVVEAMVRARLAIADGHRMRPRTGHVVVVGLGNVGTRVIRLLHRLDLEVVAIDKNEDAVGAALAEDLRIPLIIGDGSREETLRDAYVQTCRALLILSTDDVTNLQTALHAQALKPGLRVVLRLFDGDLAKWVQQTINGVLRSVSYLAAPEFAAAMMEREVIKTIPVGRHVLLVAEVPVRPGSPLDGGRVAAAERANEVRVIAMAQAGEPGAIWHPRPRQPLAAGDQLAVVARRGGLGWLLDQASPPPPPEPDPVTDE